jgi:DNA-binding transcriptional regulator YdaS (Cro superfamily)
MNDFISISELKAAALADAKRAVNGNTGLSKALEGEITPQAVAQWRQVPAERVLKVEKVTGISRHKLRPDLYPEPDQEVARS